MLRLAITSARGRLGTFTGAFVALFTASVLTMAWGMQLEAILRTQPPVERYAGTAAIVTGQQTVGADHDVALSERARVSSALAARLAAVPGVRAAIGDVSVPAALGNRNAVAHGWSSAALTPYVLTAGRAPARPDEVVTGYPATLGARLTLASTGPASTVTVVGVAHPSHSVSQQHAIFVTDAQAARLAGHPGLVDAIGVLAAPGFDASRLRSAAGGADVLTGHARGGGEYPELQQTRTILIPVTAAFAGLALFIAMFVVASTMGLSIQQREREIALLRAVAATPGQWRVRLATTSVTSKGRPSASMSVTTWSTGRPAASAMRSMRSRRSQPECRRERRDDDLVRVGARRSASIVAVYGSGSPTSPTASMPSSRRTARARSMRTCAASKTASS